MSSRILYGVVGAGLGHAMRAQVVAQHLVAAGHDVRILASGRALGVLRAHGLSCVPIDGLDFAFEAGAVQPFATLAGLLRQAPTALAHNVAATLALLDAFQPDVVLTDFESVASVVGHLLGVPIVSVDHQHVIDRAVHPAAVRGPGFAALAAACTLKTQADHYVATTFFFPDGVAPDTTLVGPILRPLVEAALVAPPPVEDHLLVYQTAGGDPRLVPALRATPGRFVVYGLGAPGHHPADAAHPGDVTLRPFDEPGFVADLASARAVVTNGGFTAIGEALALGKPVLSVPVPGQPEQALNAAWLERLGWGTSAAAVTPDALRAFFAADLPRPDDPRLLTGRRDALAAVDAALAALTPLRSAA